MNALDLAHSAYATAAPVRSPQATEYQAFARITQRLKSLAANRTDFGALAAALSDNRRLWTILAVDVAGQENALPQALRARLFYLAEFTEHHSRRVLKGEAEVGPLIEINSAIMKGLRAQAEAT